MNKKERIAVFIDLANSEDLDLKWIITQAKEEGLLEEARCYGDFRQQHLGDVALDLYAMGLTMVHCPSWSNGGGRMKRSDDRLLEKGIRDTLIKNRSITKYYLVTSDADIIPTALAILEHNKHLVLYSFKDAALGRILKSCGFEIRQAPKRGGEVDQQIPSKGYANGDLAKERVIVKTDIVKELDRLEQTSRYLTFMNTVGRVANGHAAIKEEIQQLLSCFIEQGVLERYQHPVPAIRLNRRHPLVAQALGLNGDMDVEENIEQRPTTAHEQDSYVGLDRQNPLMRMFKKEVMEMS